MIENLLVLGRWLVERLTRQEHSIDIEGFLFASGFAVLVVLVGWASQITSRSKEARDLETEFLKKARVKRDDYKKIINETGATEESFSALVDFLYSKKGKDEDVEIFERLKSIKEDLETLEKKYAFRFLNLLFMSFSFFMTGSIALFLPRGQQIWTLFPNLVFIGFAFINLIRVHNLERRYTSNIHEAMEKL